jgi:gas vesicle protein
MMNTNNGKMIVALAAAVLAGTALGLIFAPAKGEDTRSKLTDGAKEIAGNLQKRIRNEANELIG